MNAQETKDLRKEWLCGIITSALSGIFHEYYALSFRNTDRLEQVRGKPFFLISNHQSLLDIPLAEIVVREALDRYLFFVMKSSLPNFMQYLGGIKVSRIQDIARAYGTIRGKGEVMQRIRDEAKSARAKLYQNTLPSLIDSGEAVVIYPQGERVGIGETSRIDQMPARGTLLHLLQVQERVQEMRQDPSLRIPFVPLYMQYNPSKKPGSKILVDVGKPAKFDNDGLCALVGHLVEYIPSFMAT